MASDSKVDQVALAIEQVDWHDPKVIARAAIEAMRNPTDAMVDACQRALVETMRDLGWSKAQRAGRLSSQTKAVMRWNAMIDAALRG